jgi:hypothetical protein
MARFARDAMDKFCKVVRSLELTLGPDTVGMCQASDGESQCIPVNF